jgi:hypothetical protein
MPIGRRRLFSQSQHESKAARADLTGVVRHCHVNPTIGSMTGIHSLNEQNILRTPPITAINNPTGRLALLSLPVELS